MDEESTIKNQEVSKKVLEYQKLIAGDLKVYGKKRAFPIIAKCLNDQNISNQIAAIQAFVSLYETFPEEEDKLLDVFSKSFITGQKYVAITILVSLSLIHPDYAFDKLSKVITLQKDLVDFTANSLKSAWKEQEDKMISLMSNFWDLRNNLNLKKVAIMSLNTAVEDENDILIDFLGKFVSDNDAFIRTQVSLKLKELYIRVPYVVEAKMRAWLINDLGKNTGLVILNTFREINKRQDPTLLDRSCIIMKNWEKNESEQVRQNATKILNLLKERM